MIITLLVAIALILILIERRLPAEELPQVRAWLPRMMTLNLAQALIVLAAGVSWDLWFQKASIFTLSNHMPVWLQGFLAYFISTFIFYWWHRYRHESMFFWNLCHQIHHSASRIEVLTSFYKHPVEIIINSIISSALVYGILGCSIPAGAVYTILIAVAEYFYHHNLKTPHAVGYLIQRPESHRIHHKRGYHTKNFADLPIWDMMFGTFSNPKDKVHNCGFKPELEDRFEDMLLFQNVTTEENCKGKEPISFLPTCIGCQKRTACGISKLNASNNDLNSDNQKH